MADRYYGVAVGAQLPVDVTEGGSTTGAAVELRVNDSAYGDKLAVILGVRAILAYLENRETNPIA